MNHWIFHFTWASFTYLVGADRKRNRTNFRNNLIRFANFFHLHPNSTLEGKGLKLTTLWQPVIFFFFSLAYVAGIWFLFAQSRGCFTLFVFRQTSFNRFLHAWIRQFVEYSVDFISRFVKKFYFYISRDFKQRLLFLFCIDRGTIKAATSLPS